MSVRPHTDQHRIRTHAWEALHQIAHTEGSLSAPALPSPAGLMKTALFYPLDVCRTRITADVSRAGQERTYPSLSSALVRTFRAEGIMGLYRGVSVSMLGVVPYTSITFTLYDEFKVGQVVIVSGVHAPQAMCPTSQIHPYHNVWQGQAALPVQSTTPW